MNSELSDGEKIASAATKATQETAFVPDAISKCADGEAGAFTMRVKT